MSLKTRLTKLEGAPVSRLITPPWHTFYDDKPSYEEWMRANNAPSVTLDSYLQHRIVLDDFYQD